MTPEAMEDQLAQLLQAVPTRFDQRIFLQGPACAGKTCAGLGWLLHLLREGVPGRQILVMTPQRTLATPYQDLLSTPALPSGGQVTVATVGGLARRMIDLFWPLVAEEAGFAHPDEPPTFLTLETAQYYMARLVRPLLEGGAFDSVVIDRNRLYSQIIDNLNKAAVVGFPATEIAARLKAAWEGDPAHLRVYDEAEACALRFREHCLQQNLLDFSLQIEVVVKYLWSLPLCRHMLERTHRHLIVDNVEEDTPVAHDILSEWLPACESALVIYDEDGGYRRFLGADPEHARELRLACDQQVRFDETLVPSPDLAAFGRAVDHAFRPPRGRESAPAALMWTPARTISYELHRFHPEMLDWVAGEIDELVHDEGVAPGEIAVLAPFLTDALRFSLANRLEQRGIPVRSHRPSRALREEPATRCLLTLAAIAHPEWRICPSHYEVAYALMQAIDGLDLVRAQLLAEITYRARDGRPTLTSFEQINVDMQERLTFVLGERYEKLRTRLSDYAGGLDQAPEAEGAETAEPPQREPLDHFLSALFGETLSQPGFGFHRDYDAGDVAAVLIESLQKFRWVTGDEALAGKPLGQEYVEMVQDGVVAAQYVTSWKLQPEDAVLLAPAYTFLMGNRPVDYQFWLNVGAEGWWERLYQPLTQPYVLSRQWPQDAVWTDADEMAARNEALGRLVLGLVRRCRKRIILGLSELGEQGNDQRGALLAAIHHALRRYARPERIET